MKNQYRKIWMKWIDSHGYGTQWYHPERTKELCESGPMKCESTGYLVFEDDVQICYAESISFDNDGKVDAVNGLSCIPLVNISDWGWL